MNAPYFSRLYLFCPKFEKTIASMTTEILLRYLHFISIFGIVGALVSEHLLLKDQMTAKEVRRLAIVDAIYGISAIIAVTAGLLLWFSYGKLADFYTKNWIFHLKIGLVIILALLSIAPTVFFVKHRKAEQPDRIIEIPAHVKWLLRFELLILFVIPLCAVLMAKGIGYFG